MISRGIEVDFIAANSLIMRRNISLVARYSLQIFFFDCCVIKSLVALCKICFYLQQTHSLVVTRCKITPYSLQYSLVANNRPQMFQNSFVTRCRKLLVTHCKKSLVTRCKMRLLFVAKVARFKIHCYLLQNSFNTRCRSY